MGNKVKRKSKSAERSTKRHSKKKKSRKRSGSSSDDSTLAPSQRNSCGKDKKRKSRAKKRRSASSDCSPGDVKPEGKSKQSLEEHSTRGKDRVVVNGEDAPNQSRTARDSSSRDKKNPSLDEESRKKQGRVEADVGPLLVKSKKCRKRRRSSSCSSSTGDSSSSRSSSASSSSSDTSWERRRRRKKRKKKLAKKLLKREEKKRGEERRKLKKMIKERSKVSTADVVEPEVLEATQDRLLKDINVELADRARAMAPITREQWEKKQSIIRRVYDEETGRQRLIKGDGEVLEEIVSRDRHMAINKKATKGDGDFFQSRLRVNK